MKLLHLTLCTLLSLWMATAHAAHTAYATNATQVTSPQPTAHSPSRRSAHGRAQSRGVDVVQPESALTAIRLVIARLPSVVSLAALLLLLLFGYSLSEERLQALRDKV